MAVGRSASVTGKALTLDRPGAGDVQGGRQGVGAVGGGGDPAAPVRRVADQRRDLLGRHPVQVVGLDQLGCADCAVPHEAADGAYMSARHVVLGEGVEAVARSAAATSARPSRSAVHAAVSLSTWMTRSRKAMAGSACRSNSWAGRTPSRPASGASGILPSRGPAGGREFPDSLGQPRRVGIAQCGDPDTQPRTPSGDMETTVEPNHTEGS
ncbi:hypothetical protein [Streptomyces halobius]|uniref:Uncharacterized protein n=1 Tax=Streptomyces halobius TaxID=2879846 RepID=A0ABY4M6R7_9ACTN|nr:hypothetical protein [Streptomyces halobius]UQA93127.1 hypothetical protein K9S39_15880 [Streptomyces halobius]